MSAFTTDQSGASARHYVQARSPRLRRTVGLAAQALGFPLGQINVLDDRYAHTVAEHGFRGAQVVPLARSVCRQVVDSGEPVAVDDLTVDDRFADLPDVVDGGVRSYLGVPLVGRESTVIGALCMFDQAPRHITTAQRWQLREFGDIVEEQLELERRTRELMQYSERPAELLADAIVGGRMVPWFQPIVDLGTERAVAFEALARWQRADGRIEQPSRFIDVLENTDLIVELDRAILAAALPCLNRWREAYPDLRLNVNLSTLHLETDGGVERVIDIVAGAEVPPEAIDLELTESRRVDDEERARRSVAALRQAGFGVVLDDFGAGWSTLDWLLRLNVSGIKVDQAVTAMLGTPAGDVASRAIVRLARELGLSSTIEGVRTATQLQHVRRAGYRRGQGSLWSMPVPAERVDAQLR